VKKQLVTAVVFAICASIFFVNSWQTIDASESVAYPPTKYADEEYVWVSCISSDPMFVANDHVGLEQFAKEYGVKTSVIGPTEFDTAGQSKAIEEIIAQKPAGIMIMGIDNSLIGAINQAVASGIPTTMVDADIPESNRYSFVGTDWYSVGQTHAQKLVELTGGKGKIAVICILGASNYNDADRGMRDYFAKYPEIEYLGQFQSEGIAEKAAQVTTDLLTAYPDLAGLTDMCGSAPGTIAALREVGAIGKIKVTVMNVTDVLIDALAKGEIDACVGQKRKLFTYYGAKLLYDMNHSPIQITPNDRGLGIRNIPESVNTGTFVIDQATVQTFLGKN
jgi:ABC-type sugar transport system substrate-binding protein